MYRHYIKSNTRRSVSSISACGGSHSEDLKNLDILCFGSSTIIGIGFMMSIVSSIAIVSETINHPTDIIVDNSR